MVNRHEVIRWLRQSPEVSVLVVGAGINGAAVFRELALQGLNVLVVDKGDFSSGASAAASRMVHGGLRYLENGELGLVREAVFERNRLLRNAPHYVRPLPTTIPIFKIFSGLLNAPLNFLRVLNRPSERGAVVIKLGLIFYDALTRLQALSGRTRYVPGHTFRWRTQALRDVPALNPAIRCTATYYDAAVRLPERLCLELILDAQKENPQARAINYLRVAGAAGDRVTLCDEETGESLTVRPRLVLNATGPWVDLANQALGWQTHWIGGTKGSHIVVDHPELRLAIGDREIFFEHVDGRIVLIYPLEDKVLVGSTEHPIDDPDTAVCTQDEIDYFGEMVARVFPSIPIEPGQVVFRFSGVRPLPVANETFAGRITRGHSLRALPPRSDVAFPGYCLIGGKWTTFRAFAEQVADTALRGLRQSRRCDTHDVPIGGGRGYPVTPAAQAQWLAEVQSETGITPDRLQTLFERYGTYAREVAAFIVAGDDRPLRSLASYSHREIAFLATREGVVHVEDLVLRRTALAVLGQLTAELLAELTEAVGEALGWTADQRSAELERTCRRLQARHGLSLAVSAR